MPTQIDEAPKAGLRSASLRQRAAPGSMDKLRRSFWGLAWLLLFRPSPVPLFAWRRLLLRIFGARVHAGACPYPTAKVWAPWNLTMHEGSCLAEGVNCYNVARVVLGRGAIISQRVYLCTASHDYNSRGFVLVVGDITIEDNCWVASEAFIGPAVTLKESCVVLARAVVAKDIPTKMVVAGNPARVIGSRSIPTE
jgi:putative colanic acid biosynthesis acetyltransferase WcaF